MLGRRHFGLYFTPGASPIGSYTSQRGDVVFGQTAPFAKVKRLPIVAADASPQALAVGVQLNKRQAAPLAASRAAIFVHVEDAIAKGRRPKRRRYSPAPPATGWRKYEMKRKSVMIGVGVASLALATLMTPALAVSEKTEGPVKPRRNR